MWDRKPGGSYPLHSNAPPQLRDRSALRLRSTRGQSEPARRLLAASALCVVALSGTACTTHEEWVAECTRFAAHPDEGEGAGVAFADINKAMAVDACERALAGGADAKLKFRYSRALLAGTPTADEIQKAVVNARESFDGGYKIAGITLGHMYQQGLGVPRDEAEALRFQLAAAEAGSSSGKFSAGALLLQNGPDAAARARGIALLEEAGEKYPDALITIGDYYLADRSLSENVYKAAVAFQKADAAGHAMGAFRLGTTYQIENTAIYAPARGLEYLLKAANADLKEAYPEVAKAHYFARGTAQDYTKALEWANKGAGVGNAYSRYMAGYMYFNAQGTDKDALKAESLLKQAAEQGLGDAKKLLDDEVVAYADALRAMPTTEAMSCVEKRKSSYDENVIDYYNICDLKLNAVVCKRIVAGEFMSIFDGKDREQCSVRSVNPRSYIDLLYGAGEDSILLRKIIANTSIRIGACHPPLIPRLAAEKVYCEQK